MKKNTNKKDLFGKANYNGEIVKLVKITICVVIVLGLVYFFTALASGEIKFGNNNKKKEEVEATIQYDEILAGQVMNRSDKEYYVLLYKFTDTSASNLISLRDSYEAKTDALAMYMVDLEKGFNSILTPEEGQTIVEKPTSIDKLKVNDTTLLQIKNGKVTRRVTTKDKVVEYLQSLTK